MLHFVTTQRDTYSMTGVCFLLRYSFLLCDISVMLFAFCTINAYRIIYNSFCRCCVDFCIYLLMCIYTMAIKMCHFIFDYNSGIS